MGGERGGYNESRTESEQSRDETKDVKGMIQIKAAGEIKRQRE